jgi:hypothetical protein
MWWADRSWLNNLKKSLFFMSGNCESERWFATENLIVTAAVSSLFSWSQWDDTSFISMITA